MTDIDVVVRPGSRDAVLDALTAYGFVILANSDRPLSADYFGETCLTLACGVASVIFEVHTTLDKLVARPVDYAAIFARAAPAPALPGLLLPAGEDHILLLALHAAGHDFHHAPANRDLDLLLADDVDEDTLLERAREWQLETALFVSLSLLHESGSAHVPGRILHAIEPSLLRRLGVTRYRSHVGRPSAELRMGWRWIVRQTILRDDVWAWAHGVVGYAAVRVVEVPLLRARGVRGSVERSRCDG